MNNIIIFGVGHIAEVAYYFLKNDTNHNIVGFTLENEYIKDNSKFDLPIIPFEDIEHKYSPNDYELFAPCSGTNLNRFRERIYNEGKKKDIIFLLI